MPRDAAPTTEDRYRVEHMLGASRDACIILGSLDAPSLTKDMIRTRALVNCFTEIGEAASRLSESGRRLVGPFPWRQIVGMRNTVVHVYWTIELAEIVQTVNNDLPRFISALDSALAAWPAPPPTPPLPPSSTQG
jgi:uncharacterized protein with HEPN domain